MADQADATLDVSIILPTYNEAEALPHLVPRIGEALREAGIGYEILVVDDDSPDGTADVAEGLAEAHPVRTIRRRSERGLARAVLDGFDEAHAPVCLVMDADGSHPVSALPEMVRLVRDDRADIVVGSRHVPGGGSEDWPLFSQIKSRFAASLALGVTTMTDPTTGLMAVRRDLLEGLSLNPIGWKIVLETVVKAAPVRVAEVPIVFTDRVHGESKQSLRVLMQYLHHLGLLYAHRFPGLSEFVRFCIVGLLGVFVDLSTVALVKETLALDTRLCAVFGFSVAVSTNYVLNRLWTFPRGRELPLWSSYFTFVSASLIGLAVRMLTIHLLMGFPQMEQGNGYLFSNLVGIGLATFFNFAAAKYLAFDPGRLAFSEDEVSASMRPPPMEPTGAHPARRFLWAPIAVGLLGAFAYGVPLKTLATHDEGINVTMARNIAASTAHFWHPSTVPGGHADWARDDLPLLGNLPLYPALLSALDAVAGVAGMGLLSLLSLLLCIASVSRLAAIARPQAGLYTAALMASSPALLDAFRLLEFEPLLTALGCAGLLAFTQGVRALRLRTSALGGLLIGLAFQVKLWLALPYLLAALAGLVVQGAIARASGGRRRHRDCAAAAAVGFLVGAGGHLLLVAAAHPEDLGHWVKNVYLGLFNGRGVTGAKLSMPAGDGSPWDYPAMLYRSHPMLLPLCLLGVPALVRGRALNQTAVLATLVGGLCGLVPLSVPDAREPLYLLPLVPFGYALAGISLAAFASADPRFRRADRSMVVVVCVLCGAALAADLLGALLGEEGLASFPWTFGGALAACALIAWTWLRDRAAVPVAMGVLGVLAAALALWMQRPDPAPNMALVAALRPAVADAAPAEVSFVAPRAGVAQAALERAGALPTAFDGLDADARARVRAVCLPPNPADSSARLRAFVGSGAFTPAPAPGAGCALHLRRD